MQVNTAFEKYCRCFQKCAVVLNRYHTAHAADHQALGWKTKFSPHTLPQIRGGRKSLGIDSVIDHTNSVRSQPGLAGMKFTQFPRHRENSVCHGIGHSSKNSLARGKTRQALHFIAVLTVDYNRYPRQSGGGDGLQGAPIPGMNNMGPILLENTLQAK